MRSIVVVEDEKDILDLLTFLLRREGHAVVPFMDGERALDYIVSSDVDLLLLDVMLPGISGLDICKSLQGMPVKRDIPIIMITAKSEDDDIVTGMGLGAVNYVVKPFSPKVLLAKVQAVLRRIERNDVEDNDQTLEYNRFSLNYTRRRAFVGGNEVYLTYTEFQLMHLFLSEPGRAFPRETIVEKIRGKNHAVTDRAVDVQVASLRKKIGKSMESYIETVRGVGYRFKELH